MSKSKEKKELANKALADLKKHLGRDLAGRQLLEPVEEYVKELRRQVSSVKLENDELRRSLDAAIAKAIKTNVDITDLSVQFDRLADMERKTLTKLRDTMTRLLEAYDGFKAVEKEEEALEIIYRLMDRIPSRTVLVIIGAAGAYVHSTEPEENLPALFDMLADSQNNLLKKRKIDKPK